MTIDGILFIICIEIKGNDYMRKTGKCAIFAIVLNKNVYLFIIIVTQYAKIALYYN